MSVSNQTVPKSILAVFRTGPYSCRATISLDPAEHYLSPEEVQNSVKRIISTSPSKGCYGLDPGSSTFQLTLDKLGGRKVDLTGVKHNELAKGVIAKYFEPVIWGMVESHEGQPSNVVFNRLFSTEDAEILAESYNE